ncbi:MAG: Fe-S cluster protein [Deltaproteobacteria bacterium]|nr:Fe-S cluster protein [Deltaproteobacteria bacterium]MBW2070895.1 Fe-S cluster protein [Deltaproteobacteria bacterium]
MLLTGYRKEIFRPECNPQFQSLHCIAHLEEDISEVLPYLNTVLGGHQYLKEPPALTLKIYGKLITLHPREIAINALKDEAEAEKILEWLKKEINDTWEKRTEIEPSFETPEKPRVLEILKLLPKTNCRECGQPTCMVFATQVADGGRGPEDCPPLSEEARSKLEEYLGQFRLLH